MTDSTARAKATKKALRTRRTHQAEKDYYEHVIKPGRQTMFAIGRLTFMAYAKPISLRFRPGNTGRKLMHGAVYGTLMEMKPHDIIVVLIEGYKRPQTFHASFWEVLQP